MTFYKVIGTKLITTSTFGQKVNQFDIFYFYNCRALFYFDFVMYNLLLKNMLNCNKGGPYSPC